MKEKANLKRQISKSKSSAIVGLLIFTVLGLSVPDLPVTAHSPFRVAVVDLIGDAGREISSIIRDRVRSSPLIELTDEEMVRVAARGAGYVDSLNLSRDEARALGQSLGCDFYILGKTHVVRRLESGDQFHYEALAGVFIVETRTGSLLHFAFERTRGQSEKEAVNQLEQLVQKSSAHYITLMHAARKKHIAEIENVASPSGTVIEISPDSDGVHQPVFYNRLKPSYTEQAELAGITATVELEVVFQEDGVVGEIQIARWAGYGLDESAIATVRQLRFKPAERDGKVVTIRGLVRYNFSRPRLQVERPSGQSEIERLKRSLHEIKNAGQIPGKYPES